MNRSEINRRIDDALGFFERYGTRLPPWARWTPEQWAAAGPEADEIRRNRLGWDLTDFGSGSFELLGLLLFTIRNGRIEQGRPVSAKTYAEKAMIALPGQLTPWHFHWSKTEDIINRGGGRLVVEVGWATPDEKAISPEPITVQVDGIDRTVPARGQVFLEPGESITLLPKMYHAFFADPLGEAVLIGEVSTVNDDTTDNCFLEPLGRFPTIEADEPARYWLCFEYPAAPGAGTGAGAGAATAGNSL